VNVGDRVKIVSFGVWRTQVGHIIDIQGEIYAVRLDKFGVTLPFYKNELKVIK